MENFGKKTEKSIFTEHMFDMNMKLSENKTEILHILAPVPEVLLWNSRAAFDVQLEPQKCIFLG